MMDDATTLTRGASPGSRENGLKLCNLLAR